MKSERIAVALLFAGIFFGSIVWADPAAKTDEQVRAAAAKSRYLKSVIQPSDGTSPEAEPQPEKVVPKSAYQESSTEDYSTSTSSSSDD